MSSVNLVEYHQPESAHWSDAEGNPRYDADLRTARKDHLFPSVTGILAIKDKPQLTNWKIGQVVSQALTMTREKGESDNDFLARVFEQDKAERAKAPDKGTEVHQWLADYLKTGHVMPNPVGVDLQPIVAWIDQHVEKSQRDVEYHFTYPHLGYSGCIDVQCIVDGHPATIDFKTQAVKAKYDKPGFWSEWCAQLVAYAAGDMDIDLYSIVIDTQTPGRWHEPHLWNAEDKKWSWMLFLALRDAWIADRRYDPRVSEELPW
jgi:hypothetical protein